MGIIGTEKIQLNTEVSKIQWNNSNMIVECVKDSTFRADYVIVTVSLGVLKVCVGKLFDPTIMTKKLKAINELKIHTVDKIFLNFEGKTYTVKIFFRIT